VDGIGFDQVIVVEDQDRGRAEPGDVVEQDRQRVALDVYARRDQQRQRLRAEAGPELSQRGDHVGPVSPRVGIGRVE